MVELAAGLHHLCPETAKPLRWLLGRQKWTGGRTLLGSRCASEYIMSGVV